MIQKKKTVLPLILVVLDGWGIDKPNRGNAITLANTPFIDKLTKNYPNTKLYAHGFCVGLPSQQDGNSEAGHMNIGAGRLVEQDAVRIGKSINTGVFFKNTALNEAIKHVNKNHSKIHIMGMLSNGMSAHSDPDHLLALLELMRVKKVKNVYLHLFTDGRDSPKYAALNLIKNLKLCLKNNEKIATIIGRFYAMDRKKKWDRTKDTYDILVSAKGKIEKKAEDLLTNSYNNGDSDEFIEPHMIANNKREAVKSRIGDNDAVIFFNLRSDRARQMAKVFAQDDFKGSNKGSFRRKRILKNFLFVALTDFGPDLDNIITAFPGIDLNNTLPMVFRDYSQLYLAETEKYAHITYFLNGGYAGKVADEDQYMIESPDVKSYDDTPGMMSVELAGFVLKNLSKNKYDFTFLNFAAPDMIAHTGNLKATVKCCEIVDKQVEKITKAYLAKGGTVIITADHGNAEEMINLETGEIDVEHSSNQVPFIIVNKKLKNKIILRKKDGILADVLPTILKVMGIKQPDEVTGKNLIIKKRK